MFSYFWYKRRFSRVKLEDSSLIIRAVPLALSDSLRRSLFHAESIASTILCTVSRFLAAVVHFLLMESCKRFLSSCQCMHSIAQCRRVISLSSFAPQWRLVTYILRSSVSFPLDFERVLSLKIWKIGVLCLTLLLKSGVLGG